MQRTNASVRKSGGALVVSVTHWRQRPVCARASISGHLGRLVAAIWFASAAGFVHPASRGLLAEESVWRRICFEADGAGLVAAYAIPSKSHKRAAGESRPAA